MSDVLIHATTWMNHENMMLNKASQTHKTTYFISMKCLEWTNLYRKEISVSLGLEECEECERGSSWGWGIF